MFTTRTILSVFLSGVLIATSLPVAAQTQVQGQISGVARASNGKALAGHSARLRHAGTGNIGGSTTISATGEFSFTGVPYGDYLVEILDPAGSIVGTTSLVSLTAATAVVSGVTVTATSGTIATLVSSITSSIGSLFTSSAAIITAAAFASGLTAGVVTARSTASSSR